MQCKFPIATGCQKYCSGNILENFKVFFWHLMSKIWPSLQSWWTSQTTVLDWYLSRSGFSASPGTHQRIFCLSVWANINMTLFMFSELWRLFIKRRFHASAIKVIFGTKKQKTFWIELACLTSREMGTNKRNESERSNNSTELNRLSR